MLFIYSKQLYPLYVHTGVQLKNNSLATFTSDFAPKGLHSRGDRFFYKDLVPTGPSARDRDFFL